MFLLAFLEKDLIVCWVFAELSEEYKDGFEFEENCVLEYRANKVFTVKDEIDVLCDFSDNTRRQLLQSLDFIIALQLTLIRQRLRCFLTNLYEFREHLRVVFNEAYVITNLLHLHVEVDVQIALDPLNIDQLPDELELDN